MPKYWNDKPMGHTEADCLALLAYVSKHRDAFQTYASLSNASGIPVTVLRRLIRWHASDATCGRDGRCGGLCRHGDHALNDALANYARKWGYAVKYLHEKGRIIDVEHYGLSQTDCGRLFVEEDVLTVDS